MRPSILLALLVLAFPLSESLSQTSCTGQPFNTYLGSFNNVPSFSNCKPSYVSQINNYVGSGFRTGWKWQCVEYVRRYYYLTYGLQLDCTFAPCNANLWYANASKMGLQRFPNGSTVKPEVGDIATSDGSPNGHVNIVMSVSSSQVCFANQNWLNTWSDVNGTMCVPMTVSGGKYTLKPFDYRSKNNYRIQGWLRRNTSTALSIRITWPNGGEVLYTGTSYSPTWTRIGTVDSTWQIYGFALQPDGGWKQIFGGLPASQVSAFWIPNAELTSTKLFVGIWNPTTNQWVATDESDATFTIKASTTDVTAPQVAITSPSNGNTVSGNSVINASASDNVSVTKVDFYRDGSTHLGTDTTAPYSITWNTVDVSNGSHSLRAEAFDSSGNKGISSAINVTVSNTQTLALQVTQPNGGEAFVVGQTHPVTWNASNVDSSCSMVIYETHDGGPWNWLASLPCSTRSGNWKPAVPMSSAVVFVGALVNGAWQITDTSDNVFSVVPSILYLGQFAYSGWMSNYVKDGATIGAAGGNQLEAVKIKPTHYQISCTPHVAYDGWRPSVSNDQVCGTVGQGKGLEALKARFTNAPANFHIACRAYVRGLGWEPWVYDGAVCGTTGQGRPIEALQLKTEKW